MFRSKRKKQKRKGSKQKMTVSPAYLAQHDHIVLLVLENRSFDSFFGYLPHPNVNGVKDKNILYKISHSTGASPSLLAHEFHPRLSHNTLSPQMDPSEEYNALYESFTGEEWKFTSKQLSTFEHLPMDGFVSNYYRTLQKNLKKTNAGRSGAGKEDREEPSVEHLQQIADVLAPNAIPVFSYLALNFSVADAYFADVPSNTLCNRAFLQSSGSNSNVTNQNYLGIESWLRNEEPTLYDILSQAEVSWKVYYETKNMIPTSFLINFPSAIKFKEHFVPLDQLFKDLEEGTLSSFQLIEPRFLLQPNDAHVMDSDSLYNHNSLRAAEQLVLKIYSAIRESKLRDRTLFLITFDEGGNTADHARPPRAVSPYPVNHPTEMAFDFKILGQRVPFIVISSWVPPRTVIKKQLQHSSLIRSLCKKFNIERHINARDYNAPLYPDCSLFTRKTPRAWPNLLTDLGGDVGGDLGGDLGADFMSPLYSVIPGYSPAAYLLQKFVFDLYAEKLSNMLFVDRTKKDLALCVQDILVMLDLLKRVCKSIKERTGFCPWQAGLFPLMEVRFFLKKNVRIMDTMEAKHRALCLENRKKAEEKRQEKGPQKDPQKGPQKGLKTEMEGARKSNRKSNP